MSRIILLDTGVIGQVTKYLDKIIVNGLSREQGTGNREQGTGKAFRRFTFLNTVCFIYVQVLNPKRSPISINCTRWLQAQIQSKCRIILPEIADYEVRRELLRAKKYKGIKRLNELANLIEYLPITTDTMRQAASLWAQARQQGQPTAGDKTIDGDIILIAQALTLLIPDVIIATTNIGHLSRFIQADLWQNIHPS